MRYLFHLGHPAHFHLFKNTINELKNSGHEVAILIKRKDILEVLLQKSGFKYYNLLPHGRKDSKLGIAMGVLKTDLKLFRFALRFKPNLMIGTSVAISHVGKLLHIPSINVNEDDFDVVPLYSKLSYPWASIILAPNVCKMGKWSSKTVFYNGYHELAYLHPNHFKPNKAIVERYFSIDKPFFLIRFAKLTAHHDSGIKGITSEIAEKLIEILKPFGRVFITSERQLESKFEEYRIDINPLDIHHVMAFAKLFIGDSQTMAAEAGVLGTPFIRFNDFVGRIGYLDDLEIEYQLGVGIKADNSEQLFHRVEDLLSMENICETFALRRQKMLLDKIDVTTFMVWFIENYPKSVRIMKENPYFQNQFK